ncbi:MAG: DUF4118 domain-containing protein [Clostridia bacterium]|nr:DUF4118 domain-containing protein [Clostridia bacterium]
MHRQGANGLKQQSSLRKQLSSIRELILPGKQSLKQIFNNVIFTLLMLCAAFLLCTMLVDLADSATTVPLIFVLAVLLTAWRTDGYFYSFFSSLVSVFAINFVFTYPYFAFNFTITGYPVTFLTMFTVSVIVGMLTDQVKRQSRIKHEAEKEKMRANLLRSVSHDLRTPLTSIIGSTAAVLENYDRLSKDEKKELIGHVREDAQYLMRLVENILSITRIRNNNVQIVKESEAAEEIAAEAVQKFRKRFDRIPVRVNVPDELLMVPMDAMLIEQVIINLMENVVLHASGATKITLSISTDNDMAVFSVEDDGCGIDEHILPKLFEEMFPHAQEMQGDGRRNMGIGLSACMSIVQAHNGTMIAENMKTGGAKFSFMLPIGGNE